MQSKHSMQLKSLTNVARSFACAAVLFGSLAIFTPVHAEEGAPAPGQTKVVVHKKSLLDIWHEGGWVMYPLALCSTALVWLTVDLWMRTGVTKMAPPAYVQQLQDLFRSGDYVGAYQFAKNNPAPATDVSRIALSYLGDGQEATEFALFDGINKVNSAIQTRINYLSVIGVCTPMIGLIGTVLGMISAFENMGTSGIGDPSGLAKAIGEVLIATASGLFIAVPAFMFFYFLRNRLQSSVMEVQNILGALFRKMPYSHLKDCHVGEEEFYAATPNWVAGGAAPSEPAHA